MNIMVDAWLDRVDARLRIIDRSSGKEILRWDRQQLDSAFEDGNICYTDLEQGQPSAEELLILAASIGT